MADFSKDIEAINRIDAVPSMLEVICRSTGMGFAAIARVTDENWVACAVRDEIAFGLKPGGELKLETTICHEIRQSGEGVIIDNIAQNPAFVNHHTPAMYGFQSYISLPIILKNGNFFGTLCAIDPRPAKVANTATIGMFKLFAELISFHLEAVQNLETSQQDLFEERQTAELREQFIAILGHDLRNPVGAILNVAQMLQRMPTDDRVQRLAKILQDSSYRMKALIDNILDFARGRLGDGITLNRNADENVEEILNHVITELKLVWLDRTIITNYNITASVDCDGRRVAQMLSNLVSNALTHGAKDTPVTVDLFSDQYNFVIKVTNKGEQISDAVKAKLFRPFSRGEVLPNQQGLGLGLYISSEIAKAHGGTLQAESTPEFTSFSFAIPLQVTAVVS